MLTLNEILIQMKENSASDLHLTVGSPIRNRINGELKPINDEKLSEKNIEDLLKEYLNKKRLELLNIGESVDFSIGIPGISRYRVNLFKQRGNIVATFRRLPYTVPSIDSLGLPQIVHNFTKYKKGLILITGGTGSGKSTTLASLVQKISNEYNNHIITIEDPIEYLYNHSKSLVNQREVGSDTKNFFDALKGTLRQDPDVVVIGEMRDVESMHAALTIAETGHLVLATLHTNNASGTITRLVDAFPPDKQNIIRTTLSMTLVGIVSQQLIPNKNNTLSLAAEILINNQSIKALIRENNIHQIDNYILSGTKDGMIRMDDAILELYSNNIISKENALDYALNHTDLLKRINSISL